MSNYHLSLKSKNAKTGPIPVSTSARSTCPTTCTLRGAGCYADDFPLAIHWNEVSNGTRGVSFTEFCDAIAALPEAQVWRHNQAGDLPHNDGVIDSAAVRDLVTANAGKRGFTYTHHDMSVSGNRSAVKRANDGGLTVNLSCDTVAQADSAKSLGIGPVVVVVPKDTRENFKTPEGNSVVICPAATHKNVSCATCKLCAWSQRDVIIAFPAHGNKRKLVSIKAMA